MRTSFQTIIVIVFAAAFVIAIAVFSGLFSSPSSSSSTVPTGEVVVWGILPQEQMSQFVNVFNSQGLGYTINYFEHTPEHFAQDLTNALADGAQPDVVIFSSELFSQFKSKLSIIPYATYSERTFRDSNLDGAQIFLSNEGVAAVPLLVDPLVVYYNKDLLAAANFVIPPSSWTDVVAAVPIFTKRDNRGTITQSTIALGDGTNISHSRDILSALLLQTGNQMVTVDRTTGLSSATLDTPGAKDVLGFFLSFSDPNSSIYTWNRALPSSLDMFLSGKLAFYIGRASELFTIQAQNPNLNFDVVQLFQTKNAPRPVTFGSFIGASVLKSAPNFLAASAVVSSFSADTVADDLSKRLSLPPVKRSLLLVPQDNPYIATFFRAALSAFAWPDPNPAATEQIFRDMISNITSGRTDPDAAINEANRDLQSNIR